MKRGADENSTSSRFLASNNPAKCAKWGAVAAMSQAGQKSDSSKGTSGTSAQAKSRVAKNARHLLK